TIFRPVLLIYGCHRYPSCLKMTGCYAGDASESEISTRRKLGRLCDTYSLYVMGEKRRCLNGGNISVGRSGMPLKSTIGSSRWPTIAKKRSNLRRKSLNPLMSLNLD